MKIVFSLFIVTLVVGLLFLFDLPEARYTNIARGGLCEVRQIKTLPDNLDFLALGSSAVKRGVLVTKVQQEIPGFNEAFNLGRPTRQLWRSYRYLKDIEESGKRVRHIFVEFDLARIQGVDKMPVAKRYYFSTIGIMKYADIFAMSSKIPDELESKDFLVKALYSKFRFGLVRLLNGDIIKALLDDSADSIRRCTNTVAKKSKYTKGKSAIKGAKIDRIAKVERLKRIQVKKLKRQFNDLENATDERFDFNQSDAITALELFYIDEIRVIAERLGADLMFGRAWHYMQPPLTYETVLKIKSIIPEFIYPSEMLIRGHNSDKYFSDARHFNINGQIVFTDWLITKIRESE